MFGSFNKEHIDNNIFEIVKEGFQLFFNISKQILPEELILG